MVDLLIRSDPADLECETGRVTVRLITLSLRQVLRLLLLACRSSRSKDLELLVLRQELVVLRRQVPHPKTASGGTAGAHGSPTAPTSSRAAVEPVHA